jgi:hypothetical protein
MEVAQIKEAVGADALVGDIKLRKAIDVIKAAANITTKTAAEKDAEEKANESTEG